jgi:outer membrane protein TolC
VLISENTLEIIEENLKFLNQSLTETSKLFESGFVDEQDVDQLELLVSNLLNNRVYAENQKEIARMLLKVTLGMPLTEDVELTDDVSSLMIFTESGDNLLIERFELQNNLDYQGILIAERGSFLNLRNEQWQIAPKLKAFYNLNYNINNINTNVFQGGDMERLDIRWQALGVRASIPIFTGGSRVARIQQTQIDLDQVMVSKRQLEDNLKLQHTQARAEYEYALNSYMTQRRNVEIAKKIRDRTMTKYKNGLSTSLELTQAENQYQDSIRALLNAANSVLDRKVSLEKILGKYNN